MESIKEFNITVEGYNIFYLDTGDTPGKPIMLCIHGLACASKDFKYIADFFSPEYRVISISYLGCGNSDKPTEFSYKIRDQGRIINSFIEEMNLKDIILIGHSYGGGIAQSAVSMAPNNYSKLILLSSIGEHIHNMHLKMLPIAYLFGFFMKISFFDSLLQKMITAFCRANGISEKVIGEENANKALVRSIKRISFKDLAEDVKDIDIPTLYISCIDDKMVQKKVRDKIEKSINDFTTIDLKGKSHFTLKTHKNEVHNHISDYLKNY
ncbi:MAG: alpha/beta hydrolase [archaeon]|nr:alpha/beta hydrolase [archaeon]